MNRINLIFLLITLTTVCTNVFAQFRQWESIVIPGQPWMYAITNGASADWTVLHFDNSLAENWIASSSSHDLLSFGSADGLQISIYPNSTHDFIYITAIGDEIKSIQILNLSGQRVMTKSFSINQNSLDISELSAGIYFIQIELTKQMFTKKIIKE